MHLVHFVIIGVGLFEYAIVGYKCFLSIVQKIVCRIGGVDLALASIGVLNRADGVDEIHNVDSSFVIRQQFENRRGENIFLFVRKGVVASSCACDSSSECVRVLRRAEGIDLVNDLDNRFVIRQNFEDFYRENIFLVLIERIIMIASGLDRSLEYLRIRDFAESVYLSNHFTDRTVKCFCVK